MTFEQFERLNSKFKNLFQLLIIELSLRISHKQMKGREGKEKEKEEEEGKGRRRRRRKGREGKEEKEEGDSRGVD